MTLFVDIDAADTFFSTETIRKGEDSTILNKRMMMGFSMTVLSLFTVGNNPAVAYDVIVRNTTSDKVNVILYTRSDYSWDKFPQAFSNTQSVPANGGAYTFSVPVDSKHACPSYLAGYNANFNKSIAMMGCNGVEENNSTTRCCVNSAFEVYKKSDGCSIFEKDSSKPYFVRRAPAPIRQEANT